jgi:hypothetical protein
MAITGNLETMNLAELLQWLSNGQQTGTLIITNGTVEKKIFLDDGKIVSSSSSDPTGFLGHFLVSKGVIDEETLAQAISTQESDGGMLGEILVSGGALDQATLDHMLRLKAEENICDLFAWEEGSFEFLDGELPDHDLVPMSANVTGLVMEGMRRIDHNRAIKEVIPSPQCVPVAVAELLDDDEMDPGWKGVLKAVDDDRSIEDICLHTHSTEFFVCQILYHKIIEGAIKVVRPRVIASEEGPAPEKLPAAEAVVPATSPEALIGLSNSYFKDGDYESAARHIRAAASLDPHNRELTLVVKELEARILAAIEMDGVRVESFPSLEGSLEDLRNLDLSPEEGFILSRISGKNDIASMIKVSPLSEVDSLIVFWKLTKAGHIRLSDPV